MCTESMYSTVQKDATTTLGSKTKILFHHFHPDGSLQSPSSDRSPPSVIAGEYRFFRIVFCNRQVYEHV